MSFILFATLSPSTVSSDSQFSISLSTPKLIHKQVLHMALPNLSSQCLNSSPLLCVHIFWLTPGKDLQATCKYADFYLLLTHKLKWMKAEGFSTFSQAVASNIFFTQRYRELMSFRMSFSQISLNLTRTLKDIRGS